VNATLLALLTVPFATATITLFVGHRSDVTSKGISLAGSAVALVLACSVAFAHLGDAAPYGHVYAGGSGGGPPIEFSLYVDQLSALMLLLVHVVSFLVQLYSLGYLADDPRYPSYTALISIFTGAMTAVVVADDLWVLLIGWELMGMCSYFLIAQHWELPEARAGAVKAFLMTRTADLGLLFGIIVLGHRFGSYQITTIVSRILHGAFPRDELWLPALLLVIAVIGKSAQFPLHTWLPDAMPGPTPISALIHAATMVAAGVFLVARIYPLFLSAPTVMTLLAAVAAVTMLIAAVYATYTDDLKRLLAWSTVSQLAYMFGALAVGAYAAGVLHLLAHGAFKALLFLSAGSVVHAIGGSTSMRAMGGLRDKLPDTFICMTLGFMALAGLVPLVGFFTKDAVISATYDQATDGRLVWSWVAWLLLVSMVVTALLTVAYSLRGWLLVFFGQPGDEAADLSKAHESPWSMRLPLYLLTIPTAIGGLVVAYPAALLGPAHHEHLFHTVTAVLMTLLVAAVVALVVWDWRRHGERATWRKRHIPHPPVDTVYDVGLVRPVRGLALAARIGDRDVFDTYVALAGASTRGLGRALRLAQNGNVQAYLMVVVVGAAAIAVAAGVMT
jgi:NADH-quinone oxidoreductase subunit L